MFSANFTVSDKYSLISKEYISTSYLMPWKYTSLYDEQYLPELDEQIKQKLNRFFRYRFLHVAHNLDNDEKNLIIESNGEDILHYEIINRIPYNIITQERVFWKHFVSSLDCYDIQLCEDEINKMTDITDEMSTEIVSIQYKSDASFDSISIFDRDYNLCGYDNESVQRLNNFVKDNYSEFRGVIYFAPNTKKLKFKMLVNFPTVDIYYDSDTVVPGDNTPEDLMIVAHTNKEHRDVYLPYLVENNIITEEQSLFMQEKLVGNSKFDLDFIIEEDGTISDIHLHHIKIYEFSDLTGA